MPRNLFAILDELTANLADLKATLAPLALIGGTVVAEARKPATAQRRAKVAASGAKGPVSAKRTKVRRLRAHSWPFPPRHERHDLALAVPVAAAVRDDLGKDRIPHQPHTLTRVFGRAAQRALDVGDGHLQLLAVTPLLRPAILQPENHRRHVFVDSRLSVERLDDDLVRLRAGVIDALHQTRVSFCLLAREDTEVLYQILP